MELADVALREWLRGHVDAQYGSRRSAAGDGASPPPPAAAGAPLGTTAVVGALTAAYGELNELLNLLRLTRGGGAHDAAGGGAPVLFDRTALAARLVAEESFRRQALAARGHRSLALAKASATLAAAAAALRAAAPARRRFLQHLAAAGAAHWLVASPWAVAAIAAVSVARTKALARGDAVPSTQRVVDGLAAGAAAGPAIAAWMEAHAAEASLANDLVVAFREALPLVPAVPHMLCWPALGRDVAIAAGALLDAVEVRGPALLAAVRPPPSYSRAVTESTLSSGPGSLVPPLFAAPHAAPSQPLAAALPPFVGHPQLAVLLPDAGSRLLAPPPRHEACEIQARLASLASTTAWTRLPLFEALAGLDCAGSDATLDVRWSEGLAHAWLEAVGVAPSSAGSAAAELLLATAALASHAIAATVRTHLEGACGEEVAAGAAAAESIGCRLLVATAASLSRWPAASSTVTAIVLAAEEAGGDCVVALRDATGSEVARLQLRFERTG